MTKKTLRHSTPTFEVTASTENNEPVCVEIKELPQTEVSFNYPHHNPREHYQSLDNAHRISNNVSTIFDFTPSKVFYSVKGFRLNPELSFSGMLLKFLSTDPCRKSIYRTSLVMVACVTAGRVIKMLDNVHFFFATQYPAADILAFDRLQFKDFRLSI